MHLNVILSEMLFEFYTTSSAQRFRDISLIPLPLVFQSQMSFPGIKLSRVLRMIQWNSATEMTQTFIHLLESDYFKKHILLKVPVVFLYCTWFWSSHGFHHFSFKESYAASLYAVL